MSITGNRVGQHGDGALVLSLVLILLSAGLSLLLAVLWTRWRAAHCNLSGRDYDYILVPGKRLRDGLPDRDYRQRLEAAAQRWRCRPVPLYVSGGCDDGSGSSEAEVGLQVLLALGVARDSIVMEQQATNSFENIALLADTLREYQSGAVVSNRYHLPRLSLLAREMQLDMDTVPAEQESHPGPSNPGRWLQEGFYNHWLQVARLCRRLIAYRP